MSLFRVKRLDQLVAESEHGEGRLKRSLGAVQLTSLGIGAIIGAGIFATVGTAASGTAERAGAGPSLMLSFVIIVIGSDIEAIASAVFSASARSSAAGITRDTRPERSASAASIMRPVRHISIAFDLPTKRVRR